MLSSSFLVDERLWYVHQPHRVDVFWAGVSFRAGDAMTGIIGFELFNGVRIGYSYDFTTSDIGNYSSGSHEFTVGYCFSLSMDKTPQKYKSIRFL